MPKNVNSKNNKYDTVMKRMKENYEKPYSIVLPKRMPLIIRIDGKAFHTFTKGLKKPFDETLSSSMNQTALDLCKNIQNVKLAYVQSDEISLLLTDFDNLSTHQWFGGKLQKIASVSASMATLYFNKAWSKNVEEKTTIIDNEISIKEEDKKYSDSLKKAEKIGACFDSRTFVIPQEEVTNYFLARQNDAIRNSIQSVAQAQFTHKQLMYRSQDELIYILKHDKDIDWFALPLHLQRGVCVIRNDDEWTIDYKIPIFKKEGRNYIERLLERGQENE